MLRHMFLFLSRRRGLRRWIETSRLAGRLTSRFIAGRGLEDVLAVSQRIQRDGLLTSLDHLGENITTEHEARESRDAMLEAMDEIARRGLRSTVSIKLTQFGLDISGELCRANVEALLLKARDTGSMVEVDMESSGYTSRTLALVEDLHARHGSLRVAVQSYLYRSAEDVRRLNAAGLRVRLCKGAYDEPPDVAFPRKEQVDANYLELARLLLDEGVDPAMATHDSRLIDGVLAHAAQRGYGPERFEFQMLYGVRRDLQQKLVAQGHRVRLYVPYGDAWYPYFMRRLAERPANVLFLARHMLRA